MRIVRFHPDQTLLRRDQKSLSGNVGRRRGRFRTMSESCCRNAQFSSRRSRRERKNRAQQAMTTPSIRTIGSRLLEYESPEHHADFKEDRSFCEAQDAAILKEVQKVKVYTIFAAKQSLWAFLTLLSRSSMDRLCESVTKSDRTLLDHVWS